MQEIYKQLIENGINNTNHICEYNNRPIAMLSKEGELLEADNSA